MRQTLLSYLTIGRDVLLAPRRFYKSMPITEGIRRAVFFAVLIYYIRSIVFFLSSYHKGYFFHPAIVVSPAFTGWAAIILAIMPFLYLLILYAQSIFVNRIGTFFGGMANFEGAFKVLAYALFVSLFIMIPFVGIAAQVWAVIVIVVGVREVFGMDWISSILTLFFSFLFTAVLYILVFGVPAFFSKMVFLRL